MDSTEIPVFRPAGHDDGHYVSVSPTRPWLPKVLSVFWFRRVFREFMTAAAKWNEWSFENFRIVNTLAASSGFDGQRPLRAHQREDPGSNERGYLGHYWPWWGL